MENDSLNLPLDIYTKHLRLIGGVEFTQREVDILACLVRGTSTRTIPSFLSIAAKTVTSHMSKIRLKIGRSSQESIIDFVENSGKTPILKERYYLSLRNQVSFEKCLKKIPKMGSTRSPHCFIVCEREQKDKYSFLHYLEDHLKLAGFRIENKIKEGQKPIVEFIEEIETQQNDHVLYVLPQCPDALDWNKEKCIFLFPNKTEHSEELDNINYVDFSETENYYSSAFQLLKQLRIDFNFDKIIEDFKKSCGEISTFPETIEASTSLQKQKKTNTGFLEIRLKQRSKIFFFIFFMITLIGITLCVVYGRFERNTVPSIRSDLPIPTESAFLSRPELVTQLDDKFRESYGIQTAALVGIGGAGKTTLARQYAQSQKSPVIYEINAETKESLRSSFENLAWSLASTEDEQKILRGLQGIKNPIERENAVIQFVKQHLSSRPNWFLIYDNVEKFMDIQKYFPQDPHTWGKGKVILTTRNENIQNNKYVNHMILIGGLNPDQKFSLFTKIMGGQKTSFWGSSQQAEIKKFLEKIPPFPLDISVAAYYLKSTNIPYQKYLKNLETYNPEFVRVQEGLIKETGAYLKTRYGIITLSIQRLLVEHPDFSDLLLFISLLDSQRIPRELLNKYKNSHVVDEFIYNLKKYSLITNESENSDSDPSFSIHRSTQALMLAYLLGLLGIEEKNYSVSTIVTILDENINEAIDNDDFPRFKSFITHLETFLSHKLLNKEQEATVNGILGCIYKQIGDYENSKKLLIKALTNLNHADNKNHIKIGRDLAFLGLLYKHLGDYQKAQHALEQSYKYSSINFAENPTVILLTITHLGNLYKNIGQYEKSLYFLKKGLTICKQYLPQKPTKMGGSLLFLGGLYTTLGDSRKALTLLTDAHEIYKQNVPKDDVPFLWVLYYLGKANLEFGNYTEAQKIWEECLRISKKHYPENDMWVYWILTELGLTYSKLGHYAQGIALLETSLKGYTSHYGQDHLEIADVLKNLGRAYFAQGNYDESEKYFKKALAIAEFHKHPESYVCLEGLSDVRLKKVNEVNRDKSQKLRENAKIYLQQAQHIVKAHFPKDSSHLKRIEEKLKIFEQ